MATRATDVQTGNRRFIRSGRHHITRRPDKTMSNAGDQPVLLASGNQGINEIDRPASQCRSAPMSAAHMIHG